MTTLSAAGTTAAAPATSGTLGLERLVRRLVAEDGFADRAAALRAVAAYERFFFLAMSGGDRGEALAPSAAGDRVWQRHLLDTRAYTQDCARWGGGYLHREYGAPEGSFERCVRLLGAEGEPEWGRPGPAHAPPASAGEPGRRDGGPGGTPRAETVEGADLSGVLARVRRSLRDKPVVSPWVEEARRLLGEDPDLAVREYRRFLTLLVRAGERGGAAAGLTPCKLVDEFWHQHILDSRKYHRFCSAVAGRYLHHLPRYEDAHGSHKPGFERTRSLYRERFGAEPPPAVWAHMGESGAEPEPGPLYVVDTGTRMEAELEARKVDGRHYLELHPVLKRRGMPLAVWRDLLNAVNAVPQVPWADWAKGSGGAAFALVSLFGVAVAAAYARVDAATGGVVLFTLGFVLLVGWLGRGADPRQVPRVVEEHAPAFARFGVEVRASEKPGVVLVSAADEPGAAPL